MSPTVHRATASAPLQAASSRHSQGQGLPGRWTGREERGFKDFSWQQRKVEGRQKGGLHGYLTDGVSRGSHSESLSLV